MTGWAGTRDFGEFGWIWVAGGKGREEKLPLPGVDQIHLAREHETSVWRNQPPNAQFGCLDAASCWCVCQSQGKSHVTDFFFVPLSGRRATQTGCIISSAPTRHSH